jgi:DNA-binding MarR family transcriptional regulator
MARPEQDSFVGYSVVRLAHVLQRRFERALAKEQLSARQFGALSILAQSPATASAEIARAVLITPQSMSALVATLEERGLIERDRTSINGARAEVRITQEGNAVLRRAYAVVKREDDRLAALIGRERLTRLNADALHLLERVLAEERKAPK